MKKKEPQGDTDDLVEGLSALSLTEKENAAATVSAKDSLQISWVKFQTRFRSDWYFLIAIDELIEYI